MSDYFEDLMKRSREFESILEANHQRYISSLEGLASLSKQRMEIESEKRRTEHLTLPMPTLHYPIKEHTCMKCGKEIFHSGYCSDCKKELKSAEQLLESIIKPKYKLLSDKSDIYLKNLISSESEEEPEEKPKNCSCYITSACLDDLNIPRTAPEMQAMKTLTKEHILKSFSGIKDYVRYGKRAPQVVSAIRARNDAREIWEQVYTRLRDVANSVNSGNMKEGYAKYKELSVSLENKFVRGIV